MSKLSAWLAIAVGLMVAVAQIVRNYDNWENWPSWMVDEAAAAILVAAGVAALRKRTTRFLPVGWSFAAGLYISALINHAHILSLSTGAHHAAELRIVMIVAGLLAVSLVGLGLVLLDRTNRTS
ncbi:MAG: hypothetical protein ACOY5Y_08410 [Pseudomonadota bacterium]